ncbi:MAG: xylulokinase, partial [Thermoproteota archaeon]
MVARAPYIMGIDLGTSSCKTIIFTLDGKKVSSASKEYPIIHPQPEWAEQSPLDWWKAVAETVRKTLIKGSINSSDIIGLAIASQREAVVPIRGKDVLHNAIIWLDNRTFPQTELMRRLLDQEEVLSITGVGINPIFSASKILWLKENAPNAFREAECFLFAKDFIIFKLTGERVTDYSMASRTMLFDIRKKVWSNKICSTLDVPMDKLPSVKEPYAVIGEVSSQASSETSLPRGLPVVNGGGDRPCECLGAGVIHEGTVNIGTGTGSTFEAPLREPRPDLKGRVNCCCHVIPNSWEYEISISATGAALRWFRDVFGYEEVMEARKRGKDPYDLLIEAASKINQGADGLLFYPYLTGAFLKGKDSRTRTIFYGITLSHLKGHFVRAILEGVAFQYLRVFELLKELNLNIVDVSMVGGE